jgi:uncharacterized protein YecT (DUF1311 family)
VKRHHTIVIFMTILLCACNKTPVQCTAESAQLPVVGIVKERLEKTISSKLRDSQQTQPISMAKIRAAINELVLSISDIRTSKEDPNSTKRFCTGALKIRFPANVLSEADDARATSNLGSVSDLADQSDVQRQADSFTTSIDFNVQPTDDGSKVFAETESGNNMFGFAAEVIASSLLRSSIADAKRQEFEAKAQQSATESAALTEQKNASLASVKTENQLAIQTIGAIWKAIPTVTRTRLLPLQRAWIRKMSADCKVEGAASSVDPTDMEVARLGCETRLTGERISWLQQFRSTEPTEAIQSEVRDSALNAM